MAGPDIPAPLGLAGLALVTLGDSTGAALSEHSNVLAARFKRQSNSLEVGYSLSKNIAVGRGVVEGPVTRRPQRHRGENTSQGTAQHRLSLHKSKTQTDSLHRQKTHQHSSKLLKKRTKMKY